MEVFDLRTFAKALKIADLQVLADFLGGGVDFFSALRGIVVDAYYTSPVGMADIGYMGNQVLTSFSVPEEAIQYALRRSPSGGG